MGQPRRLPWTTGALLAFRAFDIVESSGTRQLRALPDGLGIVEDDVLARVYVGEAVLSRACPGLPRETLDRPAVGRQDGASPMATRVMTSDAARLALTLGLIFSPLAGLMAFLITYEEYQHHFSDRRRVMRASLEAGAFTCLVFLLLSAIVGILAVNAVP